jgi:hypothetical protein
MVRHVSGDLLASALAEAGGVHAPREHHARLRALLAAELDRGAAELVLTRSGQEDAVRIAFAPSDDGAGLLAVVPVAAEVRADPAAVPERGWLLTAAVVGALVEASGHGEGLLAGRFGDHLALLLPGPAAPEDAELAAIAFDDVHVVRVDRLRARALAVAPGILEVSDLRPPIGGGHPLLVAASVAALGGRPADEASMAEHEDAVLALRAAADGAPRPHDDPDPARRIARRILQRLHGMGKWGGYHTNVAHLARGFAGNDRALAEAVGEALIAAGLLQEKQSVGQRHVFLNPRRAGAIHEAIETGRLPPDLTLPSARTGGL